MTLSCNAFDVIVIGGGHAGTEAALAAARLGCQTLLLTQNLETLGAMSCNPSIGGIGKGHLVKEIDALGGVMGQAADWAGIHFRTLNASKGPAVQATRAQMCRQRYRKIIRDRLEAQPNLFLFQETAESLALAGGRVTGVKTRLGLEFHSRAVILTAGTFLAGKIHVGLSQHPGGRSGEPPSATLSSWLKASGFALGRLKTGTPPRIDGRTIAFDRLAPQTGEEPRPMFSYLGQVNGIPQRPCWLAHTTEETHAIIRAALDRSPLYTGVIEGIGPRYCPSIEDKVVRFADKPRHAIFVEPEGLHTSEVYPNGISTSLPFDVQERLVRSMPGFENAHITRPGYAIEYDFLDPRNLRRTLEHKDVAGLFLAGQVNGTTGYEEAAAQGLLAGINAARLALDQDLWIPLREEAYLGVMVDDLTTKGVAEPYRMFTSRAEWRLHLREDNAGMRLTETGWALGSVTAHQWEIFSKKKERINETLKTLQNTFARPQDQELLGFSISREMSFFDLLRRPEVEVERVLAFLEMDVLGEEIQMIKTEARYSGYLLRQEEEIARLKAQEHVCLSDLDFSSIKGLSNEVRQKLLRARPETLGQASRLEGITPAALALLFVHTRKKSA